MKLENKRILITGASSGIGASTARSLAAQGAKLFLVARRKEELENLANECDAKFLVQDICDRDAIKKILEFTESKIDILINNAGVAIGKDKVENANWDDWQRMLELNINATFRLTHAYTPLILKQGGGDIINVCSIAGHWTYQGGAIYCATKHALWAFTKALREETCGQNLRVMQVSPGMVETQFSVVRFRGDQNLADQTYQGMTPLTPDDIARQIAFMLEQPRHVCIDEILSMPTDQGGPSTVARG